MTCPLIALTSAEIVAPPRPSVIARATTPVTYIEAISVAGGIPLTAWAGDPLTIAGAVDGLVLCGGPDINPSVYGQTADPKLQPAALAADLFEIALVNACLARQLPVLAICRGMQLVNVARGGTLISDITSPLRHHPAPGESECQHTISIEPSQLQTIVGGELMVNSFHHQGIAELGQRLRITARAEDGLIEAIEDPAADWLIGVQWHPESLHDRQHQRLFAAFIQAASVTVSRRSAQRDERSGDHTRSHTDSHW
jgi:putative glutamine amidotransferase